MRIRNVFLALLFIGAVSSCSSSIDIGDGFYGIKTNAGEVVEIVEGPGVITKSLILDHVIIFPKIQDMEIPLSQDEKIVVSVEVVDPKQFYFLAKGSRDVLASFYGRQLNGLTSKEATQLVLKRLNESGTGINVKLPNPSLNRTPQQRGGA